MNFLITGAWQQANEYIDLIERKGHKVVFLQYEKDNLPCDYEWVEGVIGNGLFLSHPIENFVNLKYIQLTSVGFDRVPMKHIIEHDIVINNARGVYSIPMAEYALSSVLSLYKYQMFFYNNQNKHIWEKKRDLIELAGKTVCIVGCGSVGLECAKRFNAMDCVIYGIDNTPRQHHDFCGMYPIDDIKLVLSKSDIVILTLPLTDQTRNMFNRSLFDVMKSGSILVNIARGALVNTNDLLEALDSNHLFGAVLDVFEEEPLSLDSALWDMNNVIITPHNSFVGNNNCKRISKLIIDNLESVC